MTSPGNPAAAARERLAALASPAGDDVTAVRATLAALEALQRAVALRLLGSWDALGRPARPVAAMADALARPAWGSWNGVLQAVAAAVREDEAGAAQAVELTASLDALGARLGVERAAELRPLAELARTKVGASTTIAALLGLPVALRNHTAHARPEPAWWGRAAAALRPLARLHGEVDLLGAAAGSVPRPWAVGDATFHGLAPDGGARLLDAAGEPRVDAALGAEVVRAIARLAGREASARAAQISAGLADAEGVLVGDVLVGRPIARGRHATVHEGWHLASGRRVAIKLLDDSLPADTRERFRREAGYLTRVRSRHVVDVVDAGEDVWQAPSSQVTAKAPWFSDCFSSGRPVKAWLALEWVDGSSLEARRARQPDAGTLARWLAQAARGLAAVHAAGLIHRGLSPANVMVDAAGDVKLMDLGVARTLDEDRSFRTLAGRPPATPAYLAPEQLRAADADAEVGPLADVWSLCATFYEVATGRRLHDHDTADEAAVTRAKETGPPSWDVAARRRIPGQLRALIAGGLEPRPVDRPASAEALAVDAERAGRDEPIAFAPPSTARRAWLAYRRQRTPVHIAAACAAALTLGVALVGLDLDRRRAVAIGEAHRASAAALDARRAATGAAADTAAAVSARLESTAAQERAAAADAEARRGLALSWREQGRLALLASQPVLSRPSETEARRALAALVESLRVDAADPVAWLLADLAARPFLGRLDRDGGEAEQVLFAPDERTALVLRSRDVVLRGLDDGRPLAVLDPEHPADARALAYAPEPVALVVTERDERPTATAALWTVGATPAAIATAIFSAPRGALWALSRDAETVAAAEGATLRGWTRTAERWAPTGEARLPGGAGAIDRVWAASGGVVVARDGTGACWALASPPVALTPATPDADRPGILLDPRGRFLAVRRRAAGRVELSLLDPTSGRALLERRWPDGQRYEADERRLLHVAADVAALGLFVEGRLVVLALPSLEELGAIPLDRQASLLALGPGGRNALVSDGQGATVVWDVVGGRRLVALGDRGSIRGALGSRVAFSESGRETTIWAWQAGGPTGPQLAGFDGRTVEAQLLPSPDGAWLVGALGDAASGLAVWEVATGRPRHALPLRGASTAQVGTAAVSATGEHDWRSWALSSGMPLDAARRPSSAIALGQDGRSALHVADGRLLFDDRGLPAPRTLVADGVATAAFLGSSAVVWTGAEPVVHALDLATGEERSATRLQGGAIRSFDVAPKGSAVLAIDGESRTWLLSGPALERVRPLGPSTRRLFAPDGARVAVGTSDGRVELFTLGDEPPQVLEALVQEDMPFTVTPDGQRETVDGLAFSADGRLLLAHHGANRLDLWDTRDGVLLQRTWRGQPGAFLPGPTPTLVIGGSIEPLGLDRATWPLARLERLLFERVRLAVGPDDLFVELENAPVEVLSVIAERRPEWRVRPGGLEPTVEGAGPLAAALPRATGDPAPVGSWSELGPGRHDAVRPGTYAVVRTPGTRTWVSGADGAVLDLVATTVEPMPSVFEVDRLRAPWLELEGDERFLLHVPGVAAVALEVAEGPAGEQAGAPPSVWTQARRVELGEHELALRPHQAFLLHAPPGAHLAAWLELAGPHEELQLRWYARSGQLRFPDWSAALAEENAREQEATPRFLTPEAVPADGELLLTVGIGGSALMPGQRARLRIATVEPGELPEWARASAPAPRLEAGERRTLHVEGSRRPFEVVVPRGKELAVRITPEGEASAQVVVHGAAGPLARASSVGGRATARAAAATEDRVLRVELSGWGRAELEVFLEEPAAPGEHEPNDSLDQARMLQPGASLDVVPRGEDWWRVEIDRPGLLRVRVDHDPAAGHPVVSFMDARGELLTASDGPPDRPFARASQRVTPGTWFIRVEPDECRYRLSLSLEAPPPAGPFDAADESASAAPALALGRTSGLRLTGYSDFFRVAVPAGKTLVARLDHDAIDVDLTLGLFVLDSARGEASNDGSPLRLSTRHGATFWVRVTGEDGAPYALDLQLADAGPTPADAFEPNDVPGDATLLAPGPARTLHMDGADWYLVDLPAGRRIRVATEAEALETGVAVHDLEGVWTIDSGVAPGLLQSAPDVTLVSRVARRVRVLARSRDEGPYRLTVTSEEAGEAGGAGEPDDLPQDAAQIFPGELHGRSVDGRDDRHDWYRVTVPAGRIVRALVVSDAESPPGLEAYRSNGEGLAEAFMGVLQVVIPPDGALFLHVTPSSEGRAEYGLVVEEEAPPPPDTLEPNETAAAARPLKAGEHALVLEAGGEDWFAVELAAGTTLRMAAGVEEEDTGALDLLVLDAVDGKKLDGALLASGEADVLTVATRVARKVLIAARHGSKSVPFRYRLAVEVDATTPVDATEPNDCPERASVLLPGRYPDLHCSGQDHFALDVKAGDVVRATITFSHDAGDLDLALLGPVAGLRDELQEVAASRETADRERVTWTADDPGRVVLVVNGTPNRYTLEIQVTRP